VELAGIGPFIEKQVLRWMDSPPKVPKPPKIRSGFLTIAEAREVLAKDNGWLNGIKGDLQMHSEWSDGEGSIREMANAGVERGYEYVSITDHSKGLKIAGGINEEQLESQADEIRKVNRDLSKGAKPFRVLRSIELNLDPYGKGDMEARALQNLDIVLGCFHSALRKKEDQTERYLRALKNDNIQILGHPRGRIYNFRLGLAAEWSRVCGLAARLDKALEIDSYPDRQDLSLDVLKIAKKEGCRISISTDSHGPSQLRFIELGIASAMKAGIKEERVLNFMDADSLVNWAKVVRAGT
jgi:histidinol phosphatase-like PHP family hydrolase